MFIKAIKTINVIKCDTKFNHDKVCNGLLFPREIFSGSDCSQ